MSNETRIEYGWYLAGLVSNPKSFLSECSGLYSNHYGCWAPEGELFSRKRIKRSPNEIGALLAHDGASIAFARHGADLVGYAVGVQESIKRKKDRRKGNPEKPLLVTWITQLVVHEAFRRRGVAKELLMHFWTLSDNYAWGLVSANPYAVRALEKATRRRCDPKVINLHLKELMQFGASNVNYIGTTTVADVTENSCQIDTAFFVDHSNVPQMIDSISSKKNPWQLGPLKPGWEWLAFTFQEQSQMQITDDELEQMFKASDDVARQAYSRMTLDASHKWTKHTPHEVDCIVEFCKLIEGATVLDIGCGIGRHSLELASRGVNVVGIDFVESLIVRGKENAASAGVSVDLRVEDCRTADLGQEFDCVICLYDVVGSFAELSHNLKILRTIARHIKPGGYALLSVMNMELTQKIAKHSFSLRSDPDRLLYLKPSCTMENSGNVFDPDFFLLDTDKGVVYRREQFTSGSELHAELIVRDKRFSLKEIESLIEAVGLEVDWAKCVQIGKWDSSIPSDNPRAKEILLLCHKPQMDSPTVSHVPH